MRRGQGISKDRGARAELGTKLSVVMPVHNALPHLDLAIESILRQTFADFEFVILDDASDDGSWERLRHWQSQDSRIRLMQSDRNLGPVGSSNMVAKAATAPFVARMDADDISYPERMAEQLQALTADDSIGVVASLCDTINAAGRVIRPPEEWRLSRRSPFVPFAHGAMMYRQSIFDEVGGYREECVYWEDQDLVVRMAGVSKVLVIPHPLYQVRLWNRSTRVASDVNHVEAAVDRMYGATDRLRARRGYEDLLQRPADTSARVDPRVFIAMGSVSLWGGGRPRLLGRLLKRGRLGINVATISSLVWSVWATIDPGSLRSFLKFLLWARGRGAAERNQTAVQWTPSDGTPTAF